MPNQNEDNAGIPLSHSPDGTGYRLVELPPDLQQQLEREDAPTLTLHASATAALLKTADGRRTYALRQKNTSNSLILLAADGDGDRHRGGGMMRAVATLHETIELAETDGGEAAAGAPRARGKWHEKFGRGR